MSNPFTAGSVVKTAEFLRIAALPRRQWVGTWPDEAITELSQMFLRPGATGRLREVQCVALSDICERGGGLLPMGVGTGKTLVSFLAARVLQAKRPLLLVPAKLRDKTKREYAKLQETWLLPKITIESFELLSREQHAGYLDLVKPDLIIADEGQKLKNPKAAVTRRVARYMRTAKLRPGLVVMSGTITRRSLLDYWHLLRWCLGDELAPIPKGWEETVTWSSAIDGGGTGFHAAPGPLVEYMPNGTLPTLDNVRAGYMRRLTETTGVVATSAHGFEGSLQITQTRLPVPSKLREHILGLRELWETPDGHPFSEAFELWRHARELACGFFYRWNPRPPQEWLNARKFWCKFVREVLKNSRKLDTELQVTNAVKAGTVPDPLGLWRQWVSVRDSFTPNQEPVWCDDTALHHARDWLKKEEGIVWVEHTAFGRRLSEVSGRPYYGQGGLCAGKSIETETGPCIASIAANGEGRNLQRYSTNLVVSCPPSGATWEQLIGRTHRPGQESDEVNIEVLFACTEQMRGFERALSDARYIEQTTGIPQKLNVADILELTGLLV